MPRGVPELRTSNVAENHLDKVDLRRLKANKLLWLRISSLLWCIVCKLRLSVMLAVRICLVLRWE